MIALIALAFPEEDRTRTSFAALVRNALAAGPLSPISRRRFAWDDLDRRESARDRDLSFLIRQILGDARGASRFAKPPLQRRPPCTPPFPTS